MQLLRTLTTRTRSRRSGYECVTKHSNFSLLGAKLRSSRPFLTMLHIDRLGGDFPAILEKLPRQKPNKTVVTSKLSHPIFTHVIYIYMLFIKIYIDSVSLIK
ncbi:transmembrane protein [Arabidopsis thaliana]|uniref:Transmembrane protein n=1 Tax=Arabidopsis thaliana TaxID=3702 RepID=Q9ZPV3_ARATH|nr:uncharacterized protein AT2G18200 [Arabidopsis thaliana]AAD15516.1 unknown protein [Arabidopsis thaliana]AAM15457.1 unknown protein [Arabidopsis thaliana]AEC06739.1 transmembrane protein [Arabidopsis thaliana]|eukprot:NP_179412.1 transmembrane protein [Arabidopsis thaliana]